MTERTRTVERVTPKLVAEFDFEDVRYLVLLWPERDEEPEEFQVYRADVPWGWKNDPYEDVRE